MCMPSRDMMDNWKHTGSMTNNAWRYEPRKVEPISLPNPDPIPLYDNKPTFEPVMPRIGRYNDDYDDYDPLRRHY